MKKKRYEILHTSSVIMDMWDRHIYQHPSLTKKEKKRAYKIISKMYDFYCKLVKI